MSVKYKIKGQACSVLEAELELDKDGDLWLKLNGRGVLFLGDDGFLYLCSLLSPLRYGPPNGLQLDEHGYLRVR